MLPCMYDFQCWLACLIFSCGFDVRMIPALTRTNVFTGKYLIQFVPCLNWFDFIATCILCHVYKRISRREGMHVWVWSWHWSHVGLAWSACVVDTISLQCCFHRLLFHEVRQAHIAFKCQLFERGLFTFSWVSGVKLNHGEWFGIPEGRSVGELE